MCSWGRLRSGSHCSRVHTQKVRNLGGALEGVIWGLGKQTNLCLCSDSPASIAGLSLTRGGDVLLQLGRG